jgi:hypothetical protein
MLWGTPFKVETLEDGRGERKSGERICPLSYCIHCNLVRDGKRLKEGGRAPLTLTIGRRPLPAVRDLTRDDRWSTCDCTVSVLKLYKKNVSFRERCAHTHGETLKATITNKTHPAGSFFLS